MSAVADKPARRTALRHGEHADGRWAW